MAQKRSTHAAAFKAQVALAALKGDRTLAQLASLHRVHPNVITKWKKQLLTRAEEVFHKGTPVSAEDHHALEAQLYEQIGRLQTELDWLKKKGSQFH